MIANYHTHTWRCNHASGTEREYVEQAMAAGIRTLGFSDHTPYPFPDGYYSGFRMKPEQLADYCDTLTALRDEYRGRVDIHIGLEAEYYPKHFADLLALCADYPVEYLLLGQHFIANEYDGVYSGAATEDERVLAQYCAQVLEALETGKFAYIAHPDLVHFTGSDRIYKRHMRALCAGLRELGVPVEINLLGLADGRNYPDARFWQIAAEEGLTAILGCDAHRPGALADPETERSALAFAGRFGIRVIDHLEKLRSL